MRETTIWIWGRHPVLEALRAGTALSIVLATGRKPSPALAEMRRLAHQHRVPVREAPAPEVERLAPGQNAQGVAAQIRRRSAENVSELLSGAEIAQRQPFLLAVDQIQDPQNLGSLLRTAEAAGVQGIIVPERGSAPLSGAVARASAGAISHLPTLQVVNLARALRVVRESGLWLIGLDASAPHSLFSADLTVPLTLVVGSEGSGMRRLTREVCDSLVSLPMLGRIESLNAAIAGSIAMYEVVRQRTQQQRFTLE